MFDVKKAMAVAAAVGGLFYAQAQDWQNLFPSYSGLAFGDGKFVAVSEDGMIRTSANGSDWSQNFVPTGGAFRSAVYGGDAFILMQGNSDYLKSGNGQNWSRLHSGLNFECRYMAFGGGIFVGIDNEYNTISYDYEDDEWSRADGPASTTEFRHIAYGADKFVAVGNNIVSSSNGKNWVQRNPGGANVVAFGGDKFVAVAAAGTTAYTSADGASWTSVSSNAPAGMRDMAFGDGKFVAVGDGGKAAVSSDGTGWTASALNASDDFRAVRYGNSMFVALGRHGSLYTSANGASWTEKAGGRFMSYRQIAYGGNVFVAVGDSGVSVSADGRSWARKECGKGLQSVAFGGGKFVAVGDSGAIFTSANGESWEKYDGSDASTMFTSVAFGAGKFLVGGKASIGVQGGASLLVSSDAGQTWNDVSVNSSWPQSQWPVALCHSGASAGKFFGASSNGEIRSTVDGTFTAKVNVEAAPSHKVTALTYADNKFVALGTFATSNVTIVLSSDDGASANWTTSGPVPAGTKSVTFAKGYYLLAADSGNIYGSTNGQVWTPHRKTTHRNLNTIYSENGIILAAGASGAMLYLAGEPISVRHTPASNRTTLSASGMTIDNARKSPAVTLSFTPNKPGTLSVYSLTGKQLYKKRVNAGEKTVNLPSRIASNGSVIVRYSGDGRTVAKRFQMVK